MREPRRCCLRSCSNGWWISTAATLVPATRFVTERVAVSIEFSPTEAADTYEVRGRREVAAQFMQPASGNILRDLVAEGLITQQQAALAQTVPMADDVTVEADSGGHTDNRPLVFELGGTRFGINICEDTWFRYAPEAARAAGAQVLLVPNASPYHLGKQSQRVEVMRDNVSRFGLALVYANMTGEKMRKTDPRLTCFDSK